MPGPFENAHEVFFEQSDPRWGRLPYARGQMEAWLVGAFENRYVIRKAR